MKFIFNCWISCNCKIPFGRNVQTHDRDVQMHDRDLQTHDRDLQTHDRDLQTHDRDVQTHGRDVQTHGRASLTNKRTNKNPMSDKFANKYRITSSRLKNWDYSSESAYFITICTAGRDCLFGSISTGVMNYSAIGKIVLEEWEKSFVIRAELFCDAFMIMPNHLHAILRIEKNNAIAVQTHGCASLSTTHPISPQTYGCASLPNYGIAFRPPKSISSFVAGFKSSAKKRVNQYRQLPGMILWQNRFHDHIIRNDAEYQRILEYIEKNPKHWDSDIHHNP